MKTYALRIEKAESVLGYLVSGQRAVSLPRAFDTFVGQLLTALASCAAEPVQVETHAFEDLEKAKAKILKPGTKYVCFDSQSSLGIPVAVSRRFDLINGKQLGITSRPGFDELPDQLEWLKREHGTEFGIIEDDIYTGGTLRHMIKLFEKAGITITSVISGVSSTHTIGQIPVEAAVFYDPSELLELTDPRDYIFGARSGGLVVTFQGQKLRVPYDAAFADMTVRSSLNPQKVTEFTHTMRKANYRLHESLGSLGYPATLFYPSNVLRKVGFAENGTLRDILPTMLSRVVSLE